MGMVTRSNEPKTQIDYLLAHSIRELLTQVNTHNNNCPDSLILKDDIVDIVRDGDSYILLYYK